MFLKHTLHLRPRPNDARCLRLLLLFLLSSFSLLLRAQTRGDVFDTDDYPLVGATVTWADGRGTTVDASGHFELPEKAGQNQFTISYLGFATREFMTDTLRFPLRIVMVEAETALGQVEVTARDGGRSASLLNNRNIESISSKELRKAPCCSLAESFENSPVVDLTYGDPLTGRREIQMLGLRGNYTQLTLEKRPMLDGLASPYALDLIPGPWVKGIQIGKGSGSLESGANGLTGQINTELVKPTNGPKAYVNLFGSTQGRGEVNLMGNTQISKTLWLGASAHGSFTENKHDHDFDRFKDMPDRRTAVGGQTTGKASGASSVPATAAPVASKTYTTTARMCWNPTLSTRTTAGPKPGVKPATSALISHGRVSALSTALATTS